MQLIVIYNRDVKVLEQAKKSKIREKNAGDETHCLHLRKEEIKKIVFIEEDDNQTGNIWQLSQKKDNLNRDVKVLEQVKKLKIREKNAADDGFR